MEWLGEVIGSFLAGLVVGGAGGWVITWRVMSKKIAQKQTAGDNANQTQAGRDVKGVGK